MEQIHDWIYDLLTRMGLIRATSGYWDNIMILLLIIGVTVAIDYICRCIFLEMFKRVAKRTARSMRR